jgi:hypothetical protein
MGVGGASSVVGWRMNGRVWRPPMPPWNEISSSKAQPLVEVGVVEASDHDVADVLEAVGAQQVLGRVRGKGGQRVLALDAVIREVVSPAGAERDRAVLRRADEQPADVGVLTQLEAVSNNRCFPGVTRSSPAGSTG